MTTQKNFQNGIYGAASVNSAINVESTQWTKYSAEQGHGFAAEDANALFDRLCGKTVDKVGLNNELNGADRIVNGTPIQTKYCRSAYDSVDACFGADGMFRYPGQKIEVPKGQKEEAIRFMENRIKSGKVPGVSDPAKAQDMVVEGHYNYEQSLKIAKAGNIESIKFDILNQMVTCVCSAGLSFVLTYATSRIGGISRKEALRQAAIQALQTGATTLAAGVAVQQLLRTQVGRNMAAGATKAARKGIDLLWKTDFGRKLIEKTMSGILGKAIIGNAAKNACTKLLRSNIFTTTAVTVASTVPDIVKACRGRKSWKQVGKNAAVNATGAATGAAGYWAGAAIGSLILPGVGTVVGGVIGSIGGGMLGSAGSKKALDKVADDDAVLCIKHLQDAITSLCERANISSEEELADIMKRMKKENAFRQSFFEKMYKAGGKKHDGELMRQFAENELHKYFFV